MSIFTTIYNHTLGRVLPSTSYFPPKRTSSRKESDAHAQDGKQFILKRRRQDHSGDDGNKEVITKRRRVDQDRFVPIVDGEAYESTAINSPSASHHDCSETKPSLCESDRMLMPPPALTPVRMPAVSHIIGKNSTRSSTDLDSVSQASIGTRGTPQGASAEFMNDYGMEGARRHAAATSLPPHSGVWERGEKELFFHLSYRGFEPLFPRNWMKDFPTMPLSLYQPEHEEGPPLIHVHKSKGEFRAIRQLRELLDLGKTVRDKVLSSPGVRREVIIEQATKKYITWALNDVGINLQSPAATVKSNLPIHAVVRLKAGQSTAECLLEMKTRLHALRAQHYQARNIHASVERDHGSDETLDPEKDTRVAESSDNDLPVLYGIMICKSILAIFTLNSRTPAPKIIPLSKSVPAGGRLSHEATESKYENPAESVTSTEAHVQTEELVPASIDEHQQLEVDAASDPRFISDFDFSDPAKDVWNALVIAIVAMQIRRDMLLVEKAQNGDGSLEHIRAGIEDSSIIDVDDDDPDA